MMEYKTFDDYVRAVLKTDPTALTHISPEEQKKKTVAITADELINVWNELTELKRNKKTIAHLSDEIEKIQDKKIAKAKELLKRCYDTYVYSRLLRREIAQFLNSEVEQ